MHFRHIKMLVRFRMGEDRLYETNKLTSTLLKLYDHVIHYKTPLDSQCTLVVSVSALIWIIKYIYC